MKTLKSHGVYPAIHRDARRDALVGGGILVAMGLLAAILGAYGLANTREESGNDLAGVAIFIDRVVVVVGVVLIALGAAASRGGRRVRYAAAGVALCMGALFAAGSQGAWPFLVAAVPFVASAFFLARHGAGGR